MTEKEEATKTMVSEFERNHIAYSDPFELAMHAADMHDLWEPDGDDGVNLPEWLVSEAEDVWSGNY